MTTAHQREQERLQFVAARDGIPMAIVFAQRTMKAYRAALAQRSRLGKRIGYGLSYRRKLVVSCVVFRQFIRFAHLNEVLIQSSNEL